MSFEKEKEIMKQIKTIKKKYNEVKVISTVFEQIQKLSKEIDTLKKQADETHKKVQSRAKESQEKHEHIIENSKQSMNSEKKKNKLLKNLYN